MKIRRRFPFLSLVLVLVLCLTPMLPVVAWRYTRGQLARARARGVYDSPEEGIR